MSLFPSYSILLLSHGVSQARPPKGQKERERELSSTASSSTARVIWKIPCLSTFLIGQRRALFPLFLTSRKKGTAGPLALTARAMPGPLDPGDAPMKPNLSLSDPGKLVCDEVNARVPRCCGQWDDDERNVAGSGVCALCDILSLLLLL